MHAEHKPRPGANLKRSRILLCRQLPARAGFTLVEIVIVAAVIGLLAVLAIPAFVKARRETRVAEYLNSLRLTVDAFELYAMAHGAYPPDRLPGQVPNGMAEYLKRMDWTAPTPLGGRWDWDNTSVGITAGVTGIGAGLDMAGIQMVDEKIDDGNLLSGRFRRTGAGGYTYVIAD